MPAEPRPSSAIGQTYLERGQPVAVLIRWEAGPPAAASVIWHQPPRRSGPRNVLIKRGDGSLVVRPFRGLRRFPASARPVLGTVFIHATMSLHVVPLLLGEGIRLSASPAALQVTLEPISVGQSDQVTDLRFRVVNPVLR